MKMQNHFVKICRIIDFCEMRLSDCVIYLPLNNMQTNKVHTRVGGVEGGMLANEHVLVYLRSWYWLAPPPAAEWCNQTVLGSLLE